MFVVKSADYDSANFDSRALNIADETTPKKIATNNQSGAKNTNFALKKIQFVSERRPMRET